MSVDSVVLFTARNDLVLFLLLFWGYTMRCIILLWLSWQYVDAC